MLDVAIVGAGLSGLICAQQLRRSGYQVALIEKSRGLGGRLATRRLPNTCADHGVRFLDEQGTRTGELIQAGRDRNLLQAWTDSEHQLNGELGSTAVPPRYAAADGMTAIAKALATQLEIHHSLRVVQLAAGESWRLTCESGEAFEARSIGLAIPAPQAATLIESIAFPPTDLLTQVRSVEFDPCLTVIATYDRKYQAEVESLPWRSIEVNHDDVTWIGIDSSKRKNSAAPVMVLHSSAEFALRFLEAEDLQAIANHLLDCASNLLPWLNQPEILQIHRWRYAFVRRACPDLTLLATHPLPIACCGDWCGGTNVEAALRSGEATAAQINQLLDDRTVPPLDFAAILDES
ncbi:FAD-dependent oxidoreductase [Microcoleus sp. FACHB-1515]|uniref:NAD(P)/FAD-dependent oxidoreductase n=1 Tax=Cyanophyceae TaxID=3028117 RepID=UPI0016823704|nr:FAD-dependent oxidoreductase [Microcoleus sp. FACHB-1515]MBD2089202.1 FAD-dependent oxidoreductase [Microcoleus sp. FACHB-1515]